MNPLTKHPLKIFALLLSATLLFSCKKDKDDNPSSGFPKEVTIEYRVTATAGNLTKSNAAYTNETGGLSDIDDAALPFSKKFKRKVNQYEVIAITVTTEAPGGLKAEILVNDKVVKTETYTGTSVVYGSLAYQF